MSAPERWVVIINAAAGTGAGSAPALSDRLTRLFEAAGATADIRCVRGGGELAEAVRAAVAEQPAAVVAGGGDGTLSSVAAALVGTDVALGVLALGTLNHFAKDLGIPLELEAAVGVIVRGVRRRVDVGEVNGRVFINNSSLGLYPDVVRDRERQQRLGRGKWPAMLWASLGALRRYPFLSVRLVIDGSERRYRTPLVFIGNNEYRMEGLAIGERSSMSDGRLSLYVARRPGRLRLLQLAFHALFGRLRQERDFDAVQAAEIVVESRHRSLRVATDGEVTDMKPPLRYRTRPASLVVLGPRGAEGNA